MYNEEVEAFGNASQGKIKLLYGNPLGYFVSSMLAGIYVGFGILLIFSIGGMLVDQPYVKIIMGISFGIALSLVIIAGSELFTGNNMVMALGFFQKKVKLKDTLLLWLVCFIGNLVGAILIAFLFWQSGLAKGAVGEFIIQASQTKMELSPRILFTRGILCNALVCLAVWCSVRCKSESGKLIMVFWCLFAFITSGYEHSVANMTLLTAGLFADTSGALTIGGYVHNLLYVTLGNMVGGILLVALPYYLISKHKIN
ncbi:formate/nitrite transporter family protein [Anaerocolumna sp. AGMB13020]|uniref:formate/nitrite transporter family protein n=1 Tax=Anaerocolumna sp. AGMB13020 TaxID=3081750 RepID=UPI00295594A1|nr:formate/nitrite transporter family protein [Anaerocolumna sp. AGMB13020]WOO37699.1 formate/nitrite transporter family protein [Anaerocolumna sp. AGMB13020]